MCESEGIKGKGLDGGISVQLSTFTERWLAWTVENIYGSNIYFFCDEGLFSVFVCVCVAFVCLLGGGGVMRHSLECLPRYDFLSDDAQMSVVRNDWLSVFTEMHFPLWCACLFENPLCVAGQLLTLETLFALMSNTKIVKEALVKGASTFLGNGFLNHICCRLFSPIRLCWNKPAWLTGPWML